MGRHKDPLLHGLSPRHLDVLRLARCGFTNEQIATRLSVTKNTVKTHFQKIYSALRVKNRTEAVVQAGMLGLLDNEGSRKTDNNYLVVRFSRGGVFYFQDGFTEGAQAHVWAQLQAIEKYDVIFLGRRY